MRCFYGEIMYDYQRLLSDICDSAGTNSILLYTALLLASLNGLLSYRAMMMHNQSWDLCPVEVGGFVPADLGFGQGDLRAVPILSGYDKTFAFLTYARYDCVLHHIILPRRPSFCPPIESSSTFPNSL